MSSAPGKATSAHPKIPAGVILPPRELKHYQRWQRLYTTLRPAEQGYIPTATEYEDFQQWLRRQDSGYFSDVFDDIHRHITRMDSSENVLETPVATICQHSMHPVVLGQARSRCPVCTIDAHINYMKVLTQALRSAGGRAPSCTLLASEHQDNVYSAWLRGKICTLKELSELERMVEEEAEWSMQHPERKYEDIQTAAKALELYWSETGGRHNNKPPTPKKKAVVFDQDTTFEPGRPGEYFWKRSPRYEPGKYTIVQQPDEEEDVVSEDSEDYSQATVFQFGAAQESKSEDLVQEVEGISLTEDPFPELEEDDGDSDWEDIDSDPESSNLGDELEEDDGVYFDIVFDDD